MGKDSGGNTTTQKADPWAGIQPYLVGGGGTRTLKDGITPIYSTSDSASGSVQTNNSVWDRDAKTWVNPKTGLPTGTGTSNSGGQVQGQLINPESDYVTTGSSTGIYPEANKLYQGQGWTPEMQQLVGAQSKDVNSRTPGQVAQYGQLGSDLYSGKYDANIQRVADSAGSGNVRAQTVSTAQTNPTQYATAAQIQPNTGNTVSANDVRGQAVDMNQTFASMGGINPTGAIQQALSGNVNTAALDPVVSNAARRMTDSFNEQVLPGLRSGAQAAGQYGGSRQGIAEGLAAKGLSQSIGDMSAGMYSNAYQQAQQNQYGMANNMSNLGLSNATNNANRDLSGQVTNSNNALSAQQFNSTQNMLAQQFNASALNNMSQFNANLGQNNNQYNTSALNNMGQFNASQGLSAQQFNATQGQNNNQFNANLGLQNNAQSIAGSQQQVSNRQQGLNATQSGNQISDQAYQQLLSLLNAPNDYNWNNLNKYASIIQPGSGIGGSTTSSGTSASNPLASALGTAGTAAGLLGAGGFLGSGATATAAATAAAPWAWPVIGGAAALSLFK